MCTSRSEDDPSQYDLAPHAYVDKMLDDGTGACGDCHRRQDDPIHELESEIVSVAGVNPRCDICGRAQQPEDDWNAETGNHRGCEAIHGDVEWCVKCGHPIDNHDRRGEDGECFDCDATVGECKARPVHYDGRDGSLEVSATEEQAMIDEQDRIRRGRLFATEDEAQGFFDARFARDERMLRWDK